jgi:hypothetical protein
MRIAQLDVAQSSGKVLEVTIGLGRSGKLDCAEADAFLSYV